MQSDKIVARWLYLGVAMLMVQVLLGGITRLTGSGLSITEWKPILGALPPMNEAEWQLAFDKYRQIAQFRYLNQDFSLGDFQFIYFWEWFHRNWARFISVAFLFPFLYFLRRGWITRAMVSPLLGLFALGAAQGLIGWIMVASGLNDENLYVSHIRLAIHFLSAQLLIVCTYRFALGLSVKPEDRRNEPGLYRFALLMTTVLTVQLMYGAFMAGLKAATAAPTWPTINGDWIPRGLMNLHWIHHPLAIHFVHRSLAYLLLVLAALWVWKVRKVAPGLLARYRYVPAVLVLLQAVLGIATVLFSPQQVRNGFGPFEWMAELHQWVAMLLLMSLVWVLYLTRKGKRTATVTP